MKRKYGLISIITFIIILLTFSNVQAAQTINEGKDYDREMAIACALSYVPLKEGKTMQYNIAYLEKIKLVGNIVNFINAKFNLHNFADIHELDEWTVVDFHNKEFSEKSMAAFTLQKDNDVMIAFRGTDMEALADVKYGFTNYHNQEKYADKYVLEILDKYSKMDGEYNIYVTGHSLGGYLAQTAGATVAQNIKNYSNLKLVRIVDFNGIGINFLTYLGDKINYGNQSKTIETLKQLGEEGKLIEYYTYGDLVSALGVHYGEMRKLMPSIDSIVYHRTNYKILGNLNEKINLSKKIDKIIDRDTFNAFKTEITEARELYKLNNSIVAYLNLTHEADAFASIQYEKSPNAPEVKVIKATTALSSHITNDIDQLTIKQSTNIKAITSYASTKRYEWYESNNNIDWKLVKVSTINEEDEDFEENAIPTNEFNVDIANFKEGETKYIKVISYYNDNYESSKYSYNNSKKIYEYKEDDSKSRKGEDKSVEKVIKVTREKSIKTTFVTKIKSLFKRK